MQEPGAGDPMIRPRILLILLAASLLATAIPASATHNNAGTLKVHDNEDENPDVRNVPHVSCDFWLEAFGMSDDEGTITFFSWPPTGDKTVVTPGAGSADLTWSADDGDKSGDYHFLQGPFFLAEGHYRVEIHTDDGHPGSDSRHFAKTKTFWVEPCEGEPVNPPCPPNLLAASLAADQVVLNWTAVANATGYLVYRATGEADFELVGSVTGTTFLDEDVEGGVTYEYYVTAVIGNLESEDCDIVTVTTIPFFPGMAVGALALVGGVGAFWMLRRKA